MFIGRLQVVDLPGGRVAIQMATVAIKDQMDPVGITVLLVLEECPIFVALLVDLKRLTVELNIMVEFQYRNVNL